MALTRLGLNQAVNLTSNVTGALPVANGGTNLTSGFINGTTAVGKVLQVVSANITSTSTTTSSSFGASNVTATITPTSSSSKILIMMAGGMNGFAGGTQDLQHVGYCKIYRGTSEIENSTRGSGTFWTQESNVYRQLSVSIEDSPSTTSATTYTLYFKRYEGDATFSLNRDGNGHMNVILMEIAA
jgi:hypothetical protein